ncbi:MAG TPA: SpvB/TcaC N-terminal domain-containing protein, partial [Gammaproteobacteria bacterium]
MGRRVIAVVVAAFGMLSLSAAHAAVLAGKTPGNFAVSANGSASYSIPLTLPPGTAGMTPDLGLVYSSGAGDGEAGWGWSLRGFPSIRRCPASYAQNKKIGAVTYSSSDRLCLDGNQLMLVSGSYLAAGARYRTEIDNFTRITQVGSGATAYFKAELKNGRILYFGSTDDSRLKRTGGTEVLAWALRRIEDRSTYQNYISFSYFLDPGGRLLPDSVKYTGSSASSPYYDVDFVYGERPAGEFRPQYRDGSEAGFTKLLDRIDIKYGTTLVRRYELAYDLSPVTKRSRLASIQECGLGGTDCYRPVTFGWQDATNDWYELSSVPGSAGKWIDVNGDGLADSVFWGGPLSPDSPDPGDVNGEPEYTQMAYVLSSDRDSFHANVVTDIPWYSDDSNYATPLDFNADGKTDIIYDGYESDPSQATFRIATWTGSGVQEVDTGIDVPVEVFRGNYLIGDANGDGYDDIVVPNDAGGMKVLLNQKSGNGSAFSDSSGARVNLSLNGYTIDPSIARLNYATRGWTETFQSSDFDGDGRRDFLLEAAQGEFVCDPSCSGTEYTATWLLVLSRLSGNGGGTDVINLGSGIRKPVTIDINGDGLPDLAYVLNNTLR